MLREIFLELPFRWSPEKPSFLIGVYPLTDGKLAVVLCDHPNKICSVTDFSKECAAEAMRQLPDLKGLHPERDVEWFETSWLSTLSAMANGKTFFQSHYPKRHYAGESIVGRRVTRLTWQQFQRGDHGYPWRMSGTNRHHQAPEGRFLLPMLEGGAIQRDWPVPTLAEIEAKLALARAVAHA